MDADPILSGLEAVTKKWTKQRKAEERSHRARSRRSSMWAYRRTSLKEICYEVMQGAWNRASDNGRLPTHWRQVFYVARPLVAEHPEAERPLTDSYFKSVLESYLEEHEPGWDVLRGARGVFKEPYRAKDDSGLPLSTMNVRNYLHNARRAPDPAIPPVPVRFPTRGAKNRIAAVLICEKEGFDELLQAESIPERYDLALMSTKGISARAARDLAKNLGVPCFTLHDLDKNGFVMASGFPFATDLGIRIADVDEWDLAPEEQRHKNRRATHTNLVENGATDEEAEFIADGQRVELNMLTGLQFIKYVEQKLDEHGVKKVVPDADTLQAAWQRAHLARRINQLIENVQNDAAIPPIPDDLVDQIRARLDEDPQQPWDVALWATIEEDEDEEDDPAGFSPTEQPGHEDAGRAGGA
jgi:hypothetical protein